MRYGNNIPFRMPSGGNMKKYHLISNAHLDPVWQWDWEEGAAAALSTFRCAARFCNEFDGYIFCHNESLIYRWVEEYEPTLFREIQRLVKLGKWHIMGGWHDQPDCNLPSGEAFARQITEGADIFPKNSVSSRRRRSISILSVIRAAWYRF